MTSPMNILTGAGPVAGAQATLGWWLTAVSCVVVASMVRGQLFARSSLAAWKALSDTPNWRGSPPTSFSAASR